MLWRRRTERPDLSFFRSGEDWETFECLYFRDLDFIDIEDSIDSYNRKRKISKESAQKSNSHSRAYVDEQGRLHRLDAIGSGLIPSETYVQYEENLPVRAWKFWLGLGYHGKKVSGGGELADEWTYRYDGDGRLVEMVCHTYPDLDFKYRLVNEHFRHCEYEHDEEGLVRTYQWSHGRGVSGNEFSHAKILIFDRQRSEILLRHTVSKRALVSRAKPRKQIATFKFGGRAHAEKDSPWCPGCARPMEHIGSVELVSPLKNQSSLSDVSVFFCLDCLESNSYRLETVSNSHDPLRVEEHPFFPEQEIPLSRSSDPEAEPEAFVKVGGAPDWIHDSEHPTCPDCGKVMMFVCQMNSDEQVDDGRNALMFGDMGRLFTFACCRTVTNIMQCY